MDEKGKTNQRAVSGRHRRERGNPETRLGGEKDPSRCVYHSAPVRDRDRRTHTEYAGRAEERCRIELEDPVDGALERPVERLGQGPTLLPSPPWSAPSPLRL